MKNRAGAIMAMVMAITMVMTMMVFPGAIADENLLDTQQLEEGSEIDSELDSELDSEPSIEEEPGPGSEPGSGASSGPGSATRTQSLIEMYAGRFYDDLALKQEFLDAVAKKEAAGVVIDYDVLREIYWDIMLAKFGPATPISATTRSGAGGARGPSRSGSAGISIGNLKFLNNSGITIYDMQAGLVSAKFDVVNASGDEAEVMAIVKLQHTVTNAMHDVVIVERTVADESSETITAGFEVPIGAENYEIKIELWDSAEAMNLLVGEITFPGAVLPPHAKIEVVKGAGLEAIIYANGDFTVKCNGITSPPQSSGWVYTDPTNEPIIITGDLTSITMGMPWFDAVTSFEAVDLSSLISVDLEENQVTSFKVTGVPSLKYVYLRRNFGLSSLTLPDFPSVPSGNGGFQCLDLSGTALGNYTPASAPALNSAWDEIIAKLPVRNSSNKGGLCISYGNTALQGALITALASPDKQWDVYEY